MQALLVKLPDQRLGGGPGDSEDIRSHLWFSDINWEKLERKEVCAALLSVSDSTSSTCAAGAAVRSQSGRIL